MIATDDTGNAENLNSMNSHGSPEAKTEIRQCV